VGVCRLPLNNPWEMTHVGETGALRLELAVSRALLGIEFYRLQLNQYDSPVSGISTNKRAVLNSQGNTVFLIVGVGAGKRQKQYYLWSVITIEEVLINEEKEGQFYDAFGDGWLLNSPPLLNSEKFNNFKSFCGNFGFGFMLIQNSNYFKELQYLAEKYKPREAKIDFANYVEDFYRCL
jgi:hypothetical protein